MAKAKGRVKVRKLIERAETLPDVRILPMSDVHINPNNPKKALSADRKKGLNTNLDKFGMCSPLLVAPHPDLPGEFIILDGNTRYEEMSKRGHDKVPVQVLEHIATWEDIKEFVITYDRNVKAYNEDLVEAQLRELVAAGEDIDLLSNLANVPNLEELLSGGNMSDTPAFIDVTAIEEQASLLISGPRSAIDAIKALARKIKGKASTAEKLQKVLTELDAALPEDEEELILLLLIAASHLSGALTKAVIPFVSRSQKEAVFRKAQAFINAEGLTGDFAVSRAIEYMVADYEIGE